MQLPFIFTDHSIKQITDKTSVPVDCSCGRFDFLIQNAALEFVVLAETLKNINYLKLNKVSLLASLFIHLFFS